MTRFEHSDSLMPAKILSWAKGSPRALLQSSVWVAHLFKGGGAIRANEIAPPRLKTWATLSVGIVVLLIKFDRSRSEPFTACGWATLSALLQIVHWKRSPSPASVWLIAGSES